MIKAKATKDGQPLLILGLSEINIQKLKEGKPIIFSNEEVGLKGFTAIMYGETEEDILEELSETFELPV